MTRLDPAPWPFTRPILTVAMDLLPSVEDPLAAGAIEQLALALVEKDEETAALRAVLSAALTQTHAQQTLIFRLTGRIADFLEIDRAEREL